MFQSNKLLALPYILCFLALALSSLVIAQPKSVAKKAEYVVTKGGQSSLITIWFSTDKIAFSEEGSSKVALWRLWQTQPPSFYQAYPEVGYRIEFDRLASQSTKKVLEQLKSVVNDGDFKDAFVIDGKQFKLSSLENGWVVEEHMNQWNDYKTYDYADIGDNEADPVLGKLIKQGFIQGL
ncbi:hypothetical protein [Kangiella spongicola]|uniref:Uncharacterized protein n=1 Tax=Kangiella spongicola TaxID=796379 RepID=A0A318D0C6_9GAMM|nr:hypothetical protein [Kangiella spongicola]PXF62451.1 hypothetical protein DL796_11685 [Kangiella spongicola]